ncbi:recombinase family protein [Methanococcus maripaludis]|uniref:DNA invertase Pin-like site-specific DNA recombinase n=1 Tax=Methanococcus maripaludis TaxID=39152 RepID=A0A8T4CNV4_METMI|nr:recombinase family protein [Methanococcus maripaludis]MBM7408446.1 DNA invertase Pin-like site-specific DNA recombinase [Methanococcus maripaludis]MBP2220246.1 DNA invertase Pin-like site-specific DNA recombinase [Methanococcus maripaludis]
MIIGYARVSTKDQKLDRQIDELKSFGCEKIFLEKISGTKRNRPEFDKMLEMLRKDDLIVVSELTRLSRSTKDLIDIMNRFEQMEVSVKSLKEAWLDTSTAHGKLLFTIFAGLAEFERDLISERVKSGLNAARSRGKLGGRPTVRNEKINLALKMYDSKEYSINEILKATGISKSTLYNYLEKRE